MRGAVRIISFLVAIGIITVLFVHHFPTHHTWDKFSLPLAGHTVIIDAGHGGADGGAVSKSGIVEKDLNLALVLQLRDYLQQAGAVAIVTREGDYDLADQDTKSYSRRKTEDLIKRADVVNNSKASVFISIHMNSIPSPKWSGAQTFYYPSLEENKHLSYFIQEEIKRNLRNTKREPAPKKDNYLLKSVQNIPTALVEVGFLSHPAEAELLAQTEYQQKVAAAIYQGILRFMTKETIPQ